jgi:2-polyprenyl-3-methyl-5-hydroxy-6-metoxy-1,4-benzoquinol methylase
MPRLESPPVERIDPPAADLVAWNEAMVERYDIERYYETAHPIVRWLERKRIEALFDLAAPANDARILEVGCGAGHVLDRFRGWSRTGIDLSTTMLGRARRRLGDEVELTRGSADSLPFGDGTFDVVLCTEVLEHTTDPAAVVTELLRVAGPDGCVIVSVPNETNIDRAKRVLNGIPLLRRMLRSLASEGNEWHLHHFDLAGLRAIVGGAHIAKVRGVPSRFVPLRYVAMLQAAPSAGGR